MCTSDPERREAVNFILCEKMSTSYDFTRHYKPRSSLYRDTRVRGISIVQDDSKTSSGKNLLGNINQNITARFGRFWSVSNEIADAYSESAIHPRWSFLWNYLTKESHFNYF